MFARVSKESAQQLPTGKTTRPINQGKAPIVGLAQEESGHPLPTATRADFESRFGVDFSDIRVHSDPAAARSAQELNASAYTIGRHIVFGAGRYRPESVGGRMLLAHELGHAVQQRDAVPTEAIRRSTAGEEHEARRAAVGALAGLAPTPVSGSQLAIACAPTNEDPAAADLHDTEQFGDAARDFEKSNGGLGADVVARIRSGIIKLALESKTYEVAFAFFKFYSGFFNSIKKMSPDEEARARRADRLAETDTTLGFTSTTLRSDVLTWDDKRLAVLLLHEFSHTGHVAAVSSAVGGGSYQEGQSYGIEYFYAEVAGDTARMTKIQGIVGAGEVLGYMKAADLGRFQEDFKVTYALLTALREVVTKGSSARLPFPEITSAKAQLLEAEIVRSFQNPSADLARYIAYAKAHLGTFRLPPI
ncbi:DUF4157 domain-containing protein [Nocardia panacis]|uniref:DUF4157 domain-containing protein n=1 Tax=Nocardia panacis TaxID=2340916 RepID=A0A3A4JWX7_9NOCA|nr:DUF4157 domain-containing protein [Nocardia panacis]RJO75079.1 DUF4157 domain-containing protein [Nocardia panacis]